MADTELTQEERDAVAIGEYKYGFHDDVDARLPDPAAAWTRTSCARSRRTRASRSG